MLINIGVIKGRNSGNHVKQLVLTAENIKEETALARLHDNLGKQPGIKVLHYVSPGCYFDIHKETPEKSV